MPECVLTLPKFKAKQQVVFDSKATEILFGGDTRAGKSFFIRKAYILFCAQIPGLQCDIFRLHNDDVISENMTGETSFPILLDKWSKAGLVRINQTEIVFWNESRIELNHCFTGDTQVQTIDGPKSFIDLLGRDSHVNIGGESFSFRNARLTRKNAPIIEVRFEDGSTYRCTPDHKFITTFGLKEAKDLSGCLCLTSESKLSTIQGKFSTAKHTHYKKGILVTALRGFIESCGSIITGPFLLVLRFITKTGIVQITNSVILRLWKSQNIGSFTQILQKLWLDLGKALKKPILRHVNGTALPQGTNGTRSKFLQLWRGGLRKIANVAGLSTWASRITNFVVTTAKPRSIEEKTKRCVSTSPAGVEDVYCLTVPRLGVFPLSNGVLALNCSDDIVMLKHQGIAKHVRTFGESCQILERRIRALTGWVTMSEEMQARVPEKWKGTFPRIYHVTNPVGPSAGYYIRNFVDARPAYQIEKVGMHWRQYIPAYLTDNDSEDAQATIDRIKEAYPDESIQKALLECDWHQRTGEFFPEWDETRHVIEDLIPPAHWFRFRAMDLGYAEPCCVYWCAVSDGEPFYDQNRKERWYPRGAFIIYKEWYICDQRDPSKGLRFRNEDIRDGIIERTEYGHRQDPTLTDSLPFQDRGGESVPAVFADKGNGIIITKGDTSRVNGWNQLRSRLIGIKHPSLIDKYGVPLRVPMIYLVESCKYGRDYMPMLQRHPADKKREDAQEHGEATHACDTLRLIAMAHTVIKDKVTAMETKLVQALAKKPTIKTLLAGTPQAEIFRATR